MARQPNSTTRAAPLQCSSFLLCLSICDAQFWGGQPYSYVCSKAAKYVIQQSQGRLWQLDSTCSSTGSALAELRASLSLYDLCTSFFLAGQPHPCLCSDCQLSRTLGRPALLLFMFKQSLRIK